MCVNHVYSFGALYSSSYRVPAYSPNSLNKGITDWMDNAGQNNKHMDEGAWPSNAPCAGATISLQIMS